MNYKYGFAVALLACAVAMPAQAQDNYVSGTAVYTDDDRNRLVDDQLGGVELSLGRYFTDHLALEGRVGTHSLDGNDDLRLVEFGLNAKWAFARENRFSPYLLLGIGTLDADSDIFGDDSGRFTTYGFGADIKFNNSPLSANAEYRFRESDQFGQDFGDQVFAIGLNYRFGKSKSMPAPPPAPVDGDADGDGVKDSMDECPNTPAGYRVDSRGCPMDSDGDGVIDALDECPNTYRGAEVDAKGCEMDDDADGVVNRLDECPDSAPGAVVDRKGCEIEDVIELEGVNFETNSDRLLPSSSAQLDDVVDALKRYPQLVVEVAGHTDSQGDAGYNQGLSERRANTVRDYLIRGGANGDNLSAKGYGESEPVADNSSAEGRAENRRVELRILER